MSTTELTVICGSLTGNMISTTSETVPMEAKTCVKKGYLAEIKEELARQ